MKYTRISLHVINIIFIICGIYILSLDEYTIPKYTLAGFVTVLVLAIATISLINLYLSKKLNNDKIKDDVRPLLIAVFPGLTVIVIIGVFLSNLSFAVNDIYLTIPSNNIKEIQEELAAIFPDKNRIIIRSNDNVTVIKLVVSDRMKWSGDRLTEYDIKRFLFLKEVKIRQTLSFSLEIGRTVDPVLYEILNVKPGQIIPFTINRTDTKVMVINQDDESIPAHVRRYRCSVAMKINKILPKLSLDPSLESDKKLIDKYKESIKNSIYDILDYRMNYRIVPDESIKNMFGSIYIVDSYLILPFELHDINRMSCDLVVRGKPYEMRRLNMDEFSTFPVSLLANFFLPKLSKTELSVELVESVKKRNFNEFVSVINEDIRRFLGR